MMDIAKIDKNFKLETEIEREGLTFYDIKNEPFSIHGLIREDGAYVRMPSEAAARVSEGVRCGVKSTAGGRVRFITDSPYIAISTVQNGKPGMSHMPASGQAGFDVYEKADGEDVYVKSFIYPADKCGGFEGVVDFMRDGEHTITINFPLYFNVQEVYVGIKEGSTLKKAPKYTVDCPIVFYGSSITQGGCASRPGNSYQGFISRLYDADYINLGFSGNAKGEDAMAEYIAGLDMSAFIYDYDHNAPTANHLRETHERFYKIIRKAHPDIPVVFMSRPKIYPDREEEEQRAIVYETYKRALQRGENVYHIFGNELMELCQNEGTVDACHPTDLGFFSMAKRLSVEIDKFIYKVKQNEI